MSPKGRPKKERKTKTVRVYEDTVELAQKLADILEEDVADMLDKIIRPGLEKLRSRAAEILRKKAQEVEGDE